MPRIATRHAHQLAYRQRFSVGVRMVGCLVLLAGSIVLVAAVAEAGERSLTKTSWLMVSLGFVTAVFGAVLLCGERGKRIDREQRTVTRWWGLVRPLWHSTRDVQAYQGVAVESWDEAGLVRWRVSLHGAQAERLDLFDLASHEAAQGVARQVAAFLSLAIVPPAAVTAGTVACANAMPALPPASSDCWVYWRPGRRSSRFLGVALLSIAGVLLFKVVATAVSHDARWSIWLVIAVTLFALGLWLLCGGRKVEIDRQSVRIWRAWPLPPAAYDLAAFYAVIVAATAEAVEREPGICLVGLIGPEQLRLELIGPVPADEARQAAARLAATANLPLIDESQPAVRTA